MMKTTAGHVALLLLVTVTVMFTNLGATRLWDRDEPRNASCAAEMWDRGDLVVPLFNAQLRDAKPVLLYWLIISAYQTFGVNEFAARFWSALLAVGTVLGTYAIGRRLFNPSAALWGAVILATSLMFVVAGRAATPDSPLIFCSTMALLVFVLGTFGRREPGTEVVTAPALKHLGHFFPQSWPLVAGMYAVMGVGILAKGPVALVVPTAVIGMFLLIMRLPDVARDGQDTTDRAPTATWTARVLDIIRRASLLLWQTFSPWHFLRTCWYMRPLTAIAAALLVAGPWFVLVGLRTDGDFLTGFFLREHFGRATQTFENHRGSLLYYPVAILICFFPWSVFAGPTLMEIATRIRRRDDWHPGYIFLACWIGVYVGVFTLAQTKLPSYVTPCYPALALLTGCFVHHWTCGTHLCPKFLPTLAVMVLGLAGVGLMVGLPFAAARLLPGEAWLGAIGLIPLAGCIAALLLVRQGRRQLTGVAVGVAATCFIVALFSGLLVRVDKHQENHLLLDKIAANSENPSIASFRCLESSWVFYAGRPIQELTEISSNERTVTGAEPANSTSVRTFFETHREPYLITTRRHLEELTPALEPGVRVLAEAKYFLKSETLVVLGRPASVQQADITAQPRDALRR